MESDEELAAAYQAHGDPAVLEEISRRFNRLIYTTAHRFARPEAPLEDLVQVAWVGVFNAVVRYDPGRGARLVTFALSTAVGEIRRYLRDHSWSIRPPRHLGELGLRLDREHDRLAQELGRSPTPSELAARVNVSEDHALAAMDLRFAYGPQRLDETHDEDSGISLGDTLGGLDPRVDAAFWRVALAGALRTLPERQRRVLVLRYFDGLTQADTAARLHCSQMHISRLERQALSQLRTVLAQGETARD